MAVVYDVLLSKKRLFVLFYLCTDVIMEKYESFAQQGVHSIPLTRHLAYQWLNTSQSGYTTHKSL